MDSKLERLRAEKELLAEENSLLEAGLSTVTTQHGKIEKSSVLSSVGSASSRKSSEGGIDTASGEEDRVTPPDQINHSDRWQIPSAMWCRRHGFTGRVDSDWVDRRLGIQDSKLVALYGKHGEQVCIVCDCRDTFLIDLRRPLGNATPPPRAQHTLTLYLKGGQTLLFAAPSAAILNQWVTATRKVSGASIQQQQRTDRVGLDEDDDSSSSSKGTSFSTTVLPASAPSSLGNYSVKIYWDGSKYAGEWKNGLWHGHGRLRTEMPHGESDVYEGGFSHGEKDGFGDMCYSSGDSYHGEFKMGKKHGKGTYLQYLRDGAAKEGERATLEQRLELRAFLGSAVDAYRKELQDRYQGGWKEDRRHGVGIITEHAASGAVKYKAVYEQGKLVSKINVKHLYELNKPHELEYSLSEMLTMEAGLDFLPNFVTGIQGLPPFAYSIQPDLPPGMTINPQTGEISGSSSECFNARSFAVTATNKFGATSAYFTVQVMSNPFSTGNHLKVYPDGSVYNGEWRDGLWHGEGRLDLADGGGYEGAWVNGIK